MRLILRKSTVNIPYETATFELVDGAYPYIFINGKYYMHLPCEPLERWYDKVLSYLSFMAMREKTQSREISINLGELERDIIFDGHIKPPTPKSSRSKFRSRGKRDE